MTVPKFGKRHCEYVFLKVFPNFTFRCLDAGGGFVLSYIDLRTKEEFSI